MSKKANPYAIGIFVITACALFLFGLVLFSSGRFFRDETKAVLFFDGSVKGLKLGGSVTFQGVKIGEVTDMQVQLNRESGATLIPVIITIYGDKIKASGPAPAKKGEALELLIGKGLKAQLEMESIVTGILAINLDFHPDAEAHYVNVLTDYPEIPTIPSTLQQLSRTLEKLPIQKIADGLEIVITRLGELLHSEDAGSVVQSIDDVARELNKTLLGVRTLSEHIDTKVDPLSDELLLTLRSVQTSLGHANTAITSVSGMFKEDSKGRFELKRLVESLQDAADQVKELTEFLERNPESLIYGKQK